ncbi:MAG: TetR family transcriptional regulator [Marmoricola sp.]
MTVTRGEQKERTRRAILDAALELSQDGGLSALSLRQVAKAVGIVPTAFYRHFDSLDELGLALVEESFESLRTMLREVRQGSAVPREIIRSSVDVLVSRVAENRGQFAFIARERFGGPKRIRDAVGHQLDLVERELATDLAFITGRRWSGEDLNILANLMVTAMVSTAEELVFADQETTRADIRHRAERQLRMVVVGAVHWRSDHRDTDD